MANAKIQITKEKYDLLDRTHEYSIKVILLAKKIPLTIITSNLIGQFLKSGTSIGANYCEADNAESKDDFIHKLSISCKESKETIYWLKMIETACPELSQEINQILQETKELNLIFNAIIRSCRR